MKPKPAFQMYAAEFFADTAMLSPAELGALVRLMCQHWRRGDLGSDKQALSEHALCEVTDRVVQHYRREAERLNDLREEYDELSATRSKSGTKGGKANAKQMLSKTQAKGVGVRVGDSDEKERARGGLPFDPWWNIYRKGSRKLSAEQWDRLSDADRKACMEATPAYLASKPDPIYRKDGERFLRHRTWEDPIVTPQPTQPNGLMSKEQAREELKKVRERLGIAPGGPIETHMIPEPIRKALAQP